MTRYFPLQYRQLIRGVEGHLKAGLGAAADYVAVYRPLYMSVDGKMTHFNERTGGQWIRIIGNDGLRYEHAHTSERYQPGEYKAGDRIGTTGNTGEITDYPHLHTQIFDKNGKRLDPEEVFRGALMPPKQKEFQVTEKQFIDMMLPSTTSFWIERHPGQLPNIDDLVRDLRDVYHGGDMGKYMKTWMAGQ